MFPLPLPQVLPDPPGSDPAVLAAQAAANERSVGSLAGVSPPPSPFTAGAPPLPVHPAAAVGAAVGHAITGQTPPVWLQGLVNQYRQNPSQHMWRHLMLGEGVGSQYAGYQMPDWLRVWLGNQLGGSSGPLDLTRPLPGGGWAL